ncbi:MAG: DUF928 domain-containing protein [Synechococcus sp.]
MPPSSLPTLFGLGFGLIVISVSGLPVSAQIQTSTPASTPMPREMETARSQEQETRNANELNSSEPGEDRPSLDRTIQLGLLPFVPPPEEPAPQNTLGGGRRNAQCMDSSGLLTSSSALSTDSTASPELEIAALAPPPQIMGLTEREKPTVWLYQPIASVRRILLSVREEDSQQFHSQTTLDMPPNSQWVALQLPDDAPPLEPDTNYVWATIALCGNAPSPNDPATSIRIRRVNSPSSLANWNPTPTTALARAEDYARQGQWYDAVDAFVQASSSNNATVAAEDASSESLDETWQSLLDYAELSSISSPLLVPRNE